RYTGGAERYLHLLARGIAGHGFRPVLVTAGSGGLDGLKEEVRRDGFDVFEATRRSLCDPAGLYSTARLLGRLRPAILHVNLPGPFDAGYSLVAPVASLAGVKRIVATEHLPMAPSFAKARILKGFSGRFIERTITVSRDNIDHLVGIHRVPPEKIRVVYNGIPDTGAGGVTDLRRELSFSAEAFLVAVVGSLERRKGQGTLIRAMSRLPERVHLLVVGEGPAEKEYRDTAAGEGLGKRVRFLGYRDDVPGILAAVDVLAVPSTLEAAPYVILEAMAASRPVVASGIYGIPELVEEGKTGLLVEPGNERMLAEAIRTLVERNGLAERFGRAGRARYEAFFTLERSIGETVEIYRELLD
ncbi:MAG TPA: glycosyltransferase family 1 protein, partial [Candidatus Eisenbacteria bacterium]|nr:glycosyltransferase family 1 protein [Candidatus Eisenbacteria bacterium]